ncbi:hypothetical protein [Bacteroides sp.]|uniref:hypothetical protein n=1 Tax=Bacteroides sp. TaxID=29523 RepID=UPI0026274891|nr:hypothetical protein [Bacteroides sp.]MDD3039087.1 hypothetical protein [Bacteroides sp.]
MSNSNVPTPENPRIVTKEELFHFEKCRPYLTGIGEVMTELGIWKIVDKKQS